MPSASISACMVVGPTKAKPAFFRAFDSAIDSGVVGTRSPVVRGAGRRRVGAMPLDERRQPLAVAQGDGGAGRW